MSNTAQQLEIYEKISGLLKELNGLLGPTVWDYGFIFNASEINNVEFKSINLRTEQLIKQLVELVNTIQSANGLPLISGKDISELFNNSIHAYYTFRFYEARMLFADYELLRIFTHTEDRILSAAQEDRTKFTESYAIYLPGAIARTKTGKIDLAQTMHNETETNQFKSYFSFITEVNYLAPKLKKEFEDFSTVAVASYIYEPQFIEIFKYALTSLMQMVTKNIYGYLTKGYDLQQAKINVYDYYKSILIKQDLKLGPYLEEIEKNILENTENILKGLKGLETSTINTLKWEVVQLVVDEFIKGHLIPRNYYELEFRTADLDREPEAPYEYICDSFLLQNNTRVADFAIESYAITLTPRSKLEIFTYVTEGLENPKVPLERVINYF